jgi:hypothetical protein
VESATAEGLGDLQHVDAAIVCGIEDDRFPLLDLAVDRTGIDAFEIVRRLKSGSPPVYVNEARLHQGVLVLNPLALEDCQIEPLIQRLRAVLSA